MVKKIEIGQKFGRLTVVNRVDGIRKAGVLWKCICDCGNFKNVYASDLTSLHTRSCGCLYTETRAINKTHNLSNTKFYNTRLSMISRCENELDINFKNYGSRGIRVCKEWRDSFLNFKEDMYDSYLNHVEKFGEKDTTIDRIDNDKDYCKENCRWATWAEQRNNKKSTLYFIATKGNDIIYSNCVVDFSNKYNTSKDSIYKCLSKRQKQSKGWLFSKITYMEYTNAIAS